ncbi:nucleoside/nucleotide kinase family protein [Mycolicibacterium sp. BiH015]|uniref:nucleoside/nucleotide kinase family protein n=1 Tax=Mycolicibacterium sp. BiH015 TaxID=3018808 RepID=UPI0022E4EE3B|nr:nucleoside/nucleotide kinase family protein [Mycolicibacterium sp. BiH015]MDA2894573.1 nucleoside/nucleotide kinase family protein [Mycolicibacterium sp. BiH015]
MSSARVLESLAGDAVALGQSAPRAVLGIAGNPGAGKSTLATALLTAIEERRGPGWAAHVPMDGFHLADVQLTRLGMSDRKGAPETFDAAGYAHLLERVRQNTDGDIYAPGFDRNLEQPLAAAVVVPSSARLVITEGNYLLLNRPEWRRARQAMDRVWFIVTDDQIRIDRLVARHVEFGKLPDAARAWVTDVDERNAELVSSTAGDADRVVVNGTMGWALSA